MLELQQLLGAHRDRDVPEGAAVTEEAPLGVEHGPAAGADVMGFTRGVDAANQKIGKWLARLEQGPVRGPAAIVGQRKGVVVPGPGAQVALQIVARRLETGARDQGKAVLGVLLPI